jgi:hypothetical protein
VQCCVPAIELQGPVQNQAIVPVRVGLGLRMTVTAGGQQRMRPEEGRQR